MKTVIVLLLVFHASWGAPLHDGRGSELELHNHPNPPSRQSKLFNLNQFDLGDIGVEGQVTGGKKVSIGHTVGVSIEESPEAAGKESSPTWGEKSRTDVDEEAPFDSGEESPSDGGEESSSDSGEESSLDGVEETTSDVSKKSLATSEKVTPVDDDSAADLCSGKRCGDVCDTSLGMFQVMRYCQPDGSCGTNSRPSCPGKPAKDGCLQTFAIMGPCEAYILSWSYNLETGVCEEFNYGGCQGNDNRFRNHQECKDQCEYPVKPLSSILKIEGEGIVSGLGRLREDKDTEPVVKIIDGEPVVELSPLSTSCLMDATFEDGTVNSGNPYINADPPLEDRFFVDSNITRNSKFSLVHQLKKYDPSVAGSKRCESDSMNMKKGRIRAGTQYFYGFSIYLPSSWQFDRGFDDILVQWKGMGSAPFMFLTQKHEGLFLRVNSHPNENFDPKEDEDNLIKTQWTITAMAKLGLWHDFRIRVIWDFESEGVGLIEVDYKTEDSLDYMRIISVLGPNMYNREGYLKWGIYKPIWQPEPNNTSFDTRTIWFDNVRIGYSLQDVDPSV